MAHLRLLAELSPVDDSKFQLRQDARAKLNSKSL